MIEKYCKTCGTQLIIRETNRTPQQLTKQYYYTAYYFCPQCQKLFHSDDFKVINQNYDLFTRRQSLNGPFDVEIWTDGASSNNGQPHAKASWAFVAGNFEQAGLVDGKQTNNRGEALAVYHALVWAVAKGYKQIRIYTDSQITIHGVQKSPDKVKVNRDIFERIHEVIVKNDLVIEYQKVLGHSGDRNNERADRLANSLAGIK